MPGRSRIGFKIDYELDDSESIHKGDQGVNKGDSKVKNKFEMFARELIHNIKRITSKKMQCPVCTAEKWTIYAGVLQSPATQSIRAKQSSPIKNPKHVQSIPVVCRNCGCIVQFAAKHYRENFL